MPQSRRLPAGHQASQAQQWFDRLLPALSEILWQHIHVADTPDTLDWLIGRR
jgi:hypothetical protein